MDILTENDGTKTQGSDALRHEISELRSQLNQLNEQKESWYAKREEIGKKIRELISIVKDNKDRRNALTATVRQNKEKRELLHGEISSKIKDVKAISEKERQERHDSHGPNIHLIERQLEMLNKKIETEVMSFDKEKELMKKIKELKKQKEEAKKEIEAKSSSRKLSREIDHVKKEANQVHAVIQENAKLSQELHERILADSKEIDKLKVEEDAAFKQFSELKAKFTEVNNQLKEKLGMLNEAFAVADRHRLEAKEQKKVARHKTLKQKEKEVNEKIRKGEKLTTDDLLVLQGADSEEF